MAIPFRTFAVFSLAFGMLTAGYLIGPSRGATTISPPAAPKAVAEAPAPKPVETLLATRPPVPLVGPQHVNYFATVTVDQKSSTASDKPTVDMGTIASNPADPAQAQTQTAALTTDQPSGNDGNAKRAIETDGYKNVRDIVKDPDGGWHARAMRGSTEIALKVDASGNVSTQ
jgi:hypothetical protein